MQREEPGVFHLKCKLCGIEAGKDKKTGVWHPQARERIAQHIKNCKGEKSDV